MARYKSLKDHVYEYISRKIQNGELLPNQKLNENEICAELEISRTPAREALIQLSSEDLIEYIPRRGFFVKELDSKKKTDLFTVLAVLDGLAAALAVDYIQEKDIRHLEELIDQIDIAIKYNNHLNYVKHQNEFHDVYLMLSNNETLINTVNSMRFSSVRHVYISDDDAKLTEALTQLNSEHKQIVELFKKRDKEGLENLIKKSHWEAKYLDMI